MSASWPDASSQDHEAPLHHFKDVNPGLFTNILFGEGCDWNPHVLKLSREAWQGQAQGLHRLSPVPIAWRAICPDAQPQELAASLPLTALEAQL